MGKCLHLCSLYVQILWNTKGLCMGFRKKYSVTKYIIIIIIIIMIIKKFDPYESKGRKVFFVGFCFLPFFFLLMFHNCFSSVKRPDSNEWEP